MHRTDAWSVVQHGMPDLHSNCALTRDRIILKHFAFRCWELGEEDDLLNCWCREWSFDDYSTTPSTSFRVLDSRA